MGREMTEIIDRLARVKEIRVKNSGIVQLQFLNDYPDGNLVIAESGRNLPFEIKRVYFIKNLANAKAVRGKHAHKKLHQVIFCINGSFILNLDDGMVKQRILMDEPTLGIRLGPKLWHTMSHFSKDCVILVLANELFDERDYIRDYDEFLRYTCQKQ